LSTTLALSAASAELLGEVTMRKTLFTTIAAALASLTLVAAFSGSVAAAPARTHNTHVGSDVAALHTLQSRFHESISGGGDIDELMSLWTDDATFSAGGSSYDGKAEIRAFFLQSPGFTHNWVSMSPTFKTRFQVYGRTANLYFECHFVDWQADPEVVVTHTSLTGTANKVHGRWLFRHITVATVALTP
jgi:ketosteroid isomerase-like protein